LGATQETISELSGLSRSYISELESGANNPSLEAIFRLAKAFEIPPERLVLEIREEFGTQH
jgi:transcriptional regulator with XRE-family HTH domain